MTPPSRPTLEKVLPGFGSSFTLRKFDSDNCNIGNKAYWHFHPETELVYVSDGRGKRHIGDHISTFRGGDLIMLGPNVPHFSFTENMTDAHEEVVLQLREDFLGADFFDLPELLAVKTLFERARRGITFHGEAKAEAGRRLLAMIDRPPFERLLGLLDVLHLLAVTTEYQLLNADGFGVEAGAVDHERMTLLYEFVQENYARSVTLSEVAELVSMTEPAFCRYFKKLTHKTFTQFINEFRISHACRLLGDESLTISAVAFDSGFNNLSHFNKQFRLTTGVSPREYRGGLGRKLV